jgi:hypothetical protein
VAKPNYSFEKRQRELAKKKKKEEKLREKADRKVSGSPDDAGQESGGDGAADADAADRRPATPAA